MTGPTEHYWAVAMLLSDVSVSRLRDLAGHFAGGRIAGMSGARRRLLQGRLTEDRFHAVLGDAEHDDRVSFMFTLSKTKADGDETVVAVERSGGSKCLSAEVIVRGTEQDALAVAERAFSVLGAPRYAYSFPSDSVSHAQCFAAGVGLHTDGSLGATSGPDFERSDLLSRWSDAMTDRGVEHGWLRDVYSTSFLGDACQKRSIDGQPLVSWIRATRDRGELRSSPQGVLRWEVPSEHTQSIRRALSAANALYGVPPGTAGLWDDPPTFDPTWRAQCTYLSD